MTVDAGKVGIPWYRRRDYARILSIMSDQAQMPRSYESWRVRAEVLEQRLRDTGQPSIRAVIDPKNFTRWCSTNRLKANAHARLMYVEQTIRVERVSPDGKIKVSAVPSKQPVAS